MSSVARSVTVDPPAVGDLTSTWPGSIRPPGPRSLRSPVALAMVLSGTLQILWWRIVGPRGGAPPPPAPRAGGGPRAPGARDQRTGDGQ